MVTNTHITIYNRYYDKENRSDKWQKTILKDVFFDGTQGATRVSTGLESADRVTIVIPFTTSQNRVFTEPKQFDNITNPINFFTLREGDKVVKGVSDIDISGADLTELEKFHEVYTITAVDTKDFGSKHMQHWEVQAK